jgi:hypothetical protein
LIRRGLALDEPLPKEAEGKKSTVGQLGWIKRVMETQLPHDE